MNGRGTGIRSTGPGTRAYRCGGTGARLFWVAIVPGPLFLVTAPVLLITGNPTGWVMLAGAVAFGAVAAYGGTAWRPVRLGPEGLTLPNRLRTTTVPIAGIVTLGLGYRHAYRNSRWHLVVFRPDGSWLASDSIGAFWPGPKVAATSAAAVTAALGRDVAAWQGARGPAWPWPPPAFRAERGSYDGYRAYWSEPTGYLDLLHTAAPRRR